MDTECGRGLGTKVRKWLFFLLMYSKSELRSVYFAFCKKGTLSDCEAVI